MLTKLTKSFLIPIALATTTTLFSTQTAQTQGLGISIVVTEAESSMVLSANGMDNSISSELGTHLTFGLLVQEWLLRDNPDPEQNLHEDRFPLKDMIRDMYEIGQDGDRARALIARAMRLDRSTLESAMNDLQQEIGIHANPLVIGRTEQGAPTFEQNLNVRQTVKIAVSIARNHPETTPAILHHNGDCIVFSKNGQLTLVSIVGGTSGQSGCVSAAEMAINLSNERLQNAVSSQQR